MRALRSHQRVCQEQTDAVEAAGPDITGDPADDDAKVALAENKRRWRSKTKEQSEVSTPHDQQFGDGPAPNQLSVDQARGSITGEVRPDCYVD